MSELKGFNMQRVILRYNHGYITTGFYKDGMIQLDGYQNWTSPEEFHSFMLIDDFKKLIN